MVGVFPTTQGRMGEEQAWGAGTSCSCYPAAGEPGVAQGGHRPRVKSGQGLRWQISLGRGRPLGLLSHLRRGPVTWAKGTPLTSLPPRLLRRGCLALQQAHWFLVPFNPTRTPQ